MARTRQPITAFRKTKRWLSNFYYCDVWLDGEKYRSAEHAFQAAKSMHHADRAYVRLAATPGRAKIRGHKIPLRPNWDKIKVGVMLRVVESKFEDPSLSSMLVATFPRDLIEGNAWHDTFWGVDIDTGEGENMLGKILMLVRDSISKGRGSPYQEAREREYWAKIARQEAFNASLPVYHPPSALPDLPWTWDHSGKKGKLKR